jgi:hypothetical protein
MFVVGLSLAAALACSGDVIGPVSSLQFRFKFLGETAIVPGQPLVAEVEVFNPRPTAVVFEGCAPRLQLIRDGQSTETGIGVRPLEYREFRVWCGHGRSEIPPLGSLVDTLAWLGQTVDPGEEGRPASVLPLPAGPQRIRPVLFHGNEVVARGDAYEIAIRPWTQVRLVNTVSDDDPIELRIGGRVVARDVTRSSASALVVVPAGRHLIEVWREGDGAAIAADTIELAQGPPARLFAVRRAGAVREVWDIPDGGASTASFQTAVRVIHLAEAAAGVEVRLLAPSRVAPIVVAPFSYGAISPYVVGDTGSWRVVVVGGAGDTLLATGRLPVSSGATLDVFLSDSPTGRIWATPVDRQW